MRNIVLLCLLFFGITSLNAQLSINIVDATTGKSVPYAIAQIDGKYFYADENGLLQYQTQQPILALELDQLGYEKTQIQLDLTKKSPFLIQLKPKTHLLEEIIVSEAKRAIISQSNVLQDNAKMISQPRDIGDLLNDQPGFGMIKRGGYALDPVFRSFKQEQLNLVYDGGLQAVHACPGRMDPVSTHIDPAEIEKLELIRGPFSVRFGQTMGGIINVVTKAPQAGKGFGGHFETGFETNGNGKLAQLGLQYGTDRVTYAFSGGLKDFGSYSNGDNFEIPSAFKTYNYSAKVGLSTKKNEQFQLSWRQSFGRDILHVGLNMDTDEDNSSILSFDYQVKNIGSSLFGLAIKAYGSRVDHIMTNSRRPNFMMVEAVADVQSTTYGARVEGSWLPSKKSTLYTGFDAKYIGREGERTRLMKRNMMTGEPLPMPMTMKDDIWQDGVIQNYGVFAEYRSFLNKNWALNAGARLDWVHAQANNAAADFVALYNGLAAQTELNLSANASLTFSPIDQWNLQLAVGRGTRTASMIERYINHFTVGVDAYEYVGNPNLKPEANHQVEFSVATNNKEAMQVSANVFYSYITNYITAEIDENLPRKFMPMAEPRFSRRFVNVDAATQMGGELQLEYTWVPSFKTYGSIAYTRAQNLDWEEPLAEIPPLEAQFGAKFESSLAWVDARFRMVAAQNRVSVQFGENASSAFSTLDLRMGLSAFNNLDLGLGILNVFDVTYFEHLNRTFRNMSQNSVIYEPGRNVTLFLKYVF